MKFKSLEEIQSHPVWIKLQSKKKKKNQLDKQFLLISKKKKITAIDLFESLKIVFEQKKKKKNTHH